MKLNIYIGLRAIAYVITEGLDVVKHGIKRVNISFDDYYEFISGKPVSKRINRRMKAQARRNLWRFKSRKSNLRRLLQATYGCQPQHLTRTQNLQLRVKGLTQELTPQELTNVLCQLQLKRGYKSLRGVSDNENSDYLKEIENHEENAKQYPSIAAYLLTLESSRDIIFTRESYEKEFHMIMDAQNIDKKLRDKLYSIIYYQRPLKKPKVAMCDYEKNRTVAHASNPLYQEFRIWRDILNIKIYDMNQEEIEISFEQRKKWVEKCNRGSNITKANCLKDLKLKHPTHYSWYSGKLIAGNPINKAFNSLKIEADYTELWQDIYSATANERLGKLLKEKYQLNNAQINELLDLDFNKLGWSNFSIKSIRKLLPLMQEGKRLKEAILEIYGQVDFDNVALRNVVLEQHYASCQSLYLALQEKYQIDEVQFEIDHLLKQGNKGRKAIAQAKRKEDKFAKQHPELSHYDRIKLQLWEESGGISPYEPDVLISKEELFSDQYNLDHIIPKSKLYERSLANQVLCPTKLNQLKNRTTGIDFAKSLGIEEEYREAVKKFPENKQKYLLMGEEDIPDDWISRRQNSDYNTKCFATIFQGTNIPNKLLNRYQSQWKANQYNEQDARHYLQKAWVMANMSQETVNYFDNIKNESNGIDSVSIYNIQPDIAPLDLSNVFAVMPKIKFSRKTKFGYTPRFALHQESVYGERVEKSRNTKGEIVEDRYYKIRQPISKLSPAMINKIMDKRIRKIIEKRITEVGNHEDGIVSLIENPAKYNGKPIHKVSVRFSSNTVFPLRSTDGKGNTGKFDEYERKIDFVFNDKNYAIRVWIDEKAKVKREQISLIDYIKALNGGERLERGFTLMENDIVELDGNYYYLIGVSTAPKLRPTTTLAAKDDFTIKADDWIKIKKVNVNQLGEVISSYGIEDYQ
ncbi:type II CRISPR RNA-guided endonuclease Cas9 [Weeksella sp. HMSC059D05]|uniref:type II CRISPR RNA-guided endonuclease Cas9 n=1 Tax=Weeksella sp. HMSC059D05 TaxID=1715139 RepID=UPI00114C96D5|nr:type II CRISPR RNA-guided endonuclease Cas9 [Weeksella sp. HMSC059D05]